MFIISNKNLSDKYEYIAPEEIIFDSKGNYYAVASDYRADYGINNYFLIVNGKVIKSYDYIEAYSAYINKKNEYVFIFKEKDIYRTVAKNENKPEKITETIVNNKVERFYQDNCLTEQEYINESGKSIKDLIAEFNKKNGNTIEITSMVRFQLGEENK